MTTRLTSLAKIGLAAAIAWRAMRELFDETVGPLSMANAWGAWIEAFGLACGAMIATSARRPSAGRTLMALAVLRGVQAAHVRLAPRASGAPADFRVWTSNLLFLNSNPAALIAALERAQPDIVFLQELTPDVAAALETRLGDRFPFRLLAPAADPCGFGLMSRFALTGGAVEGQEIGHRFLQTATANIGGRRVDLYNAHLVSPADVELLRSKFSPGALTHLRHAQAEVIATRVRDQRRPAIIAGDLNAGPDQGPARSLAAVAADAWAVAGRGVGTTWPRQVPVLGWALPPLLRLDYVFLTTEMLATRTQRLLESTGSDHCPVIADVRWTELAMHRNSADHLINKDVRGAGEHFT